MSAPPPSSWLGAAFLLEPVANCLECGVLMIDDSDRIVFASQPMAAMFGLKVEEVLAMKPEELVQFAAGLVEDPPQLLRERRVLPQGATVVCEEFELSGAARTVVRWVARRLTTPWPCTVVVCTDITAEVDLTAAFERLAVTDGLTGLTNRRGAEQAIVRETARMQRHGGLLCFALFDIDHFKKINDTRGHSVGDQVLKQVARVMSRVVRQVDVVSRWGGEEFLLVLPQTSLDGARACAERIRRAVAELTVDNEPNITVSGGVAELGRNEAAHEAIARADTRLYVAKSTGRNQIC